MKRIGSAVTITFAHDGDLSNYAVVPAQQALKFPDSLNFEEATTLPICFAKAMYALLDVGRLRKGMSVQIHSACGGVGLAAMQMTKNDGS